jgi:hypothetical protein
MDTHQFYYGDGTENIVELTQIQADSANNLRVGEILETPEGTYANMWFEGPGDMESYNEAAEILNEFIATHAVTWENTDVPILRPVF